MSDDLDFDMEVLESDETGSLSSNGQQKGERQKSKAPVSDWEEVKLYEVVHRRSENVDPSETDLDRHVGLEHISSGDPSPDFGSIEGQSSTKRHFLPGDVLFGKLRPYLEKVAQPDFEGLCTSEIFSVVAEEAINGKFLLYRLSSKRAIDYAVRTSIGTRMPRTSWGLFENFEFELPPLPEQRKIASVLQAIDQAIQKIDEVVETLKNVLSGARKDLFENGIDGGPTKDTPMGRFPERWELKQMGDIGKLLNGNAFPKEYQGSPYGKYPFVKVSDTNNYRKYVRGAKNNISKQELKEIGCRVHPKGTVIMPKRGAAIMTNKRRIIAQPSIIDNNQIGVVGKSVKSSFLYNYLSTVDMGRFVQEGAVKSLTKSLISKIRVPVPEKDEQEKIVNIIDSIEESIKLEEEKKEVYITVKRGLMQDLLTGNVRTVDKAIEVLDEVAVHG